MFRFHDTQNNVLSSPETVICSATTATALVDLGWTVYGAKITCGGSGGTVCVIGKNCLKSGEQILELLQRNKEATGYVHQLST
ncbi:hypothetical protein K1719_022105 [Acacia pycnantha]|nr:hypothetical protein K1719_022105 [Acacia pycnantha]